MALLFQFLSQRVTVIGLAHMLQSALFCECVLLTANGKIAENMLNFLILLPSISFLPTTDDPSYFCKCL